MFVISRVFNVLTCKLIIIPDRFHDTINKLLTEYIYPGKSHLVKLIRTLPGTPHEIVHDHHGKTENLHGKFAQRPTTIQKQTNVDGSAEQSEHTINARQALYVLHKQAQDLPSASESERPGCMQVSHSRAHLFVSRFLWSSSSSSAAPKRSLIARAPFAGSAGIPTPMASLTTAPEMKPKRHQNVLVMRHGDRMDNFVESWLREAARPWDPPLYEAGRERASRTGMELRTQLGFPIDRVVVSPFVRCVETASEVVSALSAAGERASATRRAVLPIDPPAIKVCRNN